MSNSIRLYPTTHAQWLETVAAGESQDATIEQMDTARQALASRADRLARKRGARVEHAQLVARYDALLSRLLVAGWR